MIQQLSQNVIHVILCLFFCYPNLITNQTIIINLKTRGYLSTWLVPKSRLCKQMLFISFLFLKITSSIIYRKNLQYNLLLFHIINLLTYMVIGFIYSYTIFFICINSNVCMYEFFTYIFYIIEQHFLFFVMIVLSFVIGTCLNENFVPDR